MKCEVVAPRKSLVGPLLSIFFAVLLVGLVDSEERRPVPRNTNVDRWGMPYELYRRDGVLVVQSFGPDRTPFTSDDIWSN